MENGVLILIMIMTDIVPLRKSSHYFGKKICQSSFCTFTPDIKTIEEWYRPERYSWLDSPSQPADWPAVQPFVGSCMPRCWFGRQPMLGTGWYSFLSPPGPLPCCQSGKIPICYILGSGKKSTSALQTVHPSHRVKRISRVVRCWYRIYLPKTSTLGAR